MILMLGIRVEGLFVEYKNIYKTNNVVVIFAGSDSNILSQACKKIYFYRNGYLAGTRYSECVAGTWKNRKKCYFLALLR